MHVHRPAPRVVTLLGALLVFAIGVPGIVMRPATDSLAGFLVCSTLAFGLVLLWRVRVECSLDPEGRALRVVCVRWPLARTERVVGLETIERVDVRVRRGANAVVIVLRGGEEFAMPGGGSSSGAHAETADVLRRWLDGPEQSPAG